MTLRAVSQAGGGSGGGGVETVTGTAVDNTDPQNPVINTPTVPIATTTSVGTVSVGATLRVTGAGVLTAPVATMSNVGVVRASTGLVVDGSGLLSIAPGVTNGSNAGAGRIGEYTEAALITPASIPTTDVTINVISLALTAGDWDVDGVVQVNMTSGDATTAVFGGISATSETFGAFGTYTSIQATVAVSAVNNMVLPTTRISVATATTVYLVARATFSVGTTEALGFIRARRMR